MIRVAGGRPTSPGDDERIASGRLVSARPPWAAECGDLVGRLERADGAATTSEAAAELSDASSRMQQVLSSYTL